MLHSYKHIQGIIRHLERKIKNTQNSLIKSDIAIQNS